MIASSSKFRFLSTDYSFCLRSLLSYLIQPNPCTILIGKAVIAFSRPFIDAESLEIFQLRYIHNFFFYQVYDQIECENFSRFYRRAKE